MNLRRLCQTCAADVALAEQLVLEAADYRLQTYGRFPQAADGTSLFTGFPAECADENRFVFAVCDGKHTVGLLQVARAYPTPASAHIGLLLISSQHRHRHIGCHAVEQLAHKLRTWDGIQRMELGVLSSNQAAIRFWQHCGFTTTASDCFEPGIVSRGNVMMRPLKAKPACKGGHCETDSSHAHARHLTAIFR